MSEAGETAKTTGAAKAGRVAAGGGATFHPLAELTKVRLREFVREKEAVFWVFVFPVLLAFALGIAFRNTGPERARVGVETGPASESRAAAERVASALSAAPDIEPILLAPEEAAKALRTGNVALVISPADGGGVAPGGPPAVAYRYDPTRPESRAAQLGVDAALARAAGLPDPVGATHERVSEPGGRYIDFLIPGLIGLNLMGSGMWGIGFTIVTARGRKLLKLFAATPMRREHYLFSFMLSRLVFLMLEVGALLLFGWLAFGVAVRGPLALVFAVAVLGGLTFSGLGLLVAARPSTVEGVSGLMNFVMLPMWLLSGTFFSSERFPDLLQPFIKALPLTALNDALRAVINEGASAGGVLLSLAVLAAWGLASFALALRIFRWQ
ncbi:MAG TPA: ABC transporter permease [Pyrinomonadaceae bacterium]|nr:ABC transporter permease [Pyrinomonadaceae bacterium]